MIGVFDSGVGGLSVWREIRKCVPDAPIVYLADQAHVPYGARSLEEVRALTLRCTRWLVSRGCTVLVIACNTASGAALETLRETFPDTPVVGMEPAIKPAALCTKTGVIGVLATPVTFKSRRYADLIARFSRGLTVIEQTCPGWVERVEGSGLGKKASAPAQVDMSTPESLILPCVTPLLDRNADTLVLGCTHFPFLAPDIARAIEVWCARRLHAQDVTLIDPAPAVAQQTLRVWRRDSRAFAGHEFWTTGSAETFSRVASALLQCDLWAQTLDLSHLSHLSHL